MNIEDNMGIMLTEEFLHCKYHYHCDSCPYTDCVHPDTPIHQKNCVNKSCFTCKGELDGKTCTNKKVMMKHVRPELIPPDRDLTIEELLEMGRKL